MPEDVRERLGPDAVVHILLYGQALCGQAGIPKDWPKNHWWTHPSERDLVTCKGCLEACAEDTSDTDAPASTSERFIHRKKPDPEPEAEEGEEPAKTEFVPESVEQGIYIEWAKRTAATFSARVYVVKVPGELPGRCECVYGLQFSNDPYRSRVMVDPAGKVWECDILT